MNTTTRIGKIGRLPKSIRDELGRRIENGEQGKEIVKWLNGLPRVQEILEEQFDGRAITEQNLSEWKQTGHQDWLRHEESCERLRRLAERAGDLDDAADGAEISDRLGSIYAAEMALVAEKSLENVTDPKERLRIVREFLRELHHLRHEDHIGQRIQLHREQWEREVERQQEEDFERTKNEHRKRLRSMCFAPMLNKTMAEYFGGGESGKKMAELLHRIKFDLPLEDLTDTDSSGKTSPNGAKPNPTQSDSIQPNPT